MTSHSIQSSAAAHSASGAMQCRPRDLAIMAAASWEAEVWACTLRSACDAAARDRNLRRDRGHATAPPAGAIFDHDDCGGAVRSHDRSPGPKGALISLQAAAPRFAALARASVVRWCAGSTDSYDDDTLAALNAALDRVTALQHPDADDAGDHTDHDQQVDVGRVAWAAGFAAVAHSAVVTDVEVVAVSHSEEGDATHGVDAGEGDGAHLGGHRGVSAAVAGGTWERVRLAVVTAAVKVANACMHACVRVAGGAAADGGPEAAIEDGGTVGDETAGKASSKEDISPACLVHAMEPGVRRRLSHGCTLCACALLSLGARDDVVDLLRTMWSFRVPLESGRAYGGPQCLAPLLDAVHVFLRKKRWPDAHSGATSEALPSTAPPTAAAATCDHCGDRFRSRNALFRHLRTACALAPAEQGGHDAAAVAATDGTVAASSSAPSLTHAGSKRARTSKDPSFQQLNARNDVANTATATASMAPPPPPLISPTAAKLWLGDVPPSLCTLAKVRKVLYQALPPTCPMPHVAKLVRKGYRAPMSSSTRLARHDVATMGQTTAAADTPCAEQNVQPEHHVGADASRWLGYAFVCFRDHDEASDILAALDGHIVCDEGTLRLKWADPDRIPGAVRDNGHPDSPLGDGAASSKRAADVENSVLSEPQRSLAVGEDPPLREQLAPRCFGGRRVRAMLQHHAAALGDAVPTVPPLTVDALVTHYASFPRRERRAAGRPVDRVLLNSLRLSLDAVRWPAARQRSTVRAERYLLLYRNRRNPGFEALADAVWAVLERHEPTYPCTMVAVTKNFEGSPHTDERDVTHQLALSVGDWTRGGELCVEGDNPTEVWVVNTHDRLARVDGRFVHWVRGWDGGDRCSVIYFCTDEASATKATSPVLQ